MRNFLRAITGWLWKKEIEDLRQRLRDTEHHRDNLLWLIDSSKTRPAQLQDENLRLRHLCFQMRMTFRRIKGRGTDCVPYNWPDPERIAPPPATFDAMEVFREAELQRPLP